MFIPEHLQLAVKHGAAFLDEHEPGWEKRLDLESLALFESCNCVIGQLYGDYDSGVSALSLGNPLKGQVVDLGFYLPVDSCDTWDQLTAAWRREVCSRTGDES